MTTPQAGSASSLRLFFALWPDKPSRTALARLAGELARDGHGRAARDANLHLTLAFLGDVPSTRLDALVALGHDVAAQAGAFPLSLEHIGGTSFRIAWLAPAAYNEPLHALQAVLVEALAAVGHARERERRMFRPHVTLARDCMRSVHRGRISPIAWQVEQLSLVASMTDRGGAEYREIAGWQLGAGDQSTATV